MKKMTLALLMTVFTASTLFSTVSQADGPPGPQWHQQGGHGGSDRGPGHERGGEHGHDNRGRGAERHYESHERFAWQGHEFRRGEPLPPRFRGDDYRVRDWRDRGLSEPPRGAHWAYINGNYVLIAAATGVITSILLNNAMH